VELHEIQALLPQPSQGSVYDGFDITSIHRSKIGQVRNEFGMNLYPFRVRGIRLTKATDQKLDAGIYIRAIECRNPRLDERRHIPPRLIRIDGSVVAGKVPAAFDDA
jgi:hypothetical protein